MFYFFVINFFWEYASRVGDVVCGLFCSVLVCCFDEDVAAHAVWSDDGENKNFFLFDVCADEVDDLIFSICSSAERVEVALVSGCFLLFCCSFVCHDFILIRNAYAFLSYSSYTYSAFFFMKKVSMSR